MSAILSPSSYVLDYDSRHVSAAMIVWINIRQSPSLLCISNYRHTILLMLRYCDVISTSMSHHYHVTAADDDSDICFLVCCYVTSYVMHCELHG